MGALSQYALLQDGDKILALLLNTQYLCCKLRLQKVPDQDWYGNDDVEKETGDKPVMTLFSCEEGVLCGAMPFSYCPLRVLFMVLCKLRLQRTLGSAPV
ncbi:hypothetical protein Mfla_2127 [Methylobacillus flagellatus KT]|uniref:Uncharacterized protein n=1 Tax=Methylobacillus flagellatus (strain ATCC 51484 / DSM 6875 / VKM B-1610 / KT) TaxID=265072 RepID=Q1GZE3_METFK|nr:hypothetical protein Mfla_2127 [Methylobacillus flagellatus KT]